MAPSLLKSKVSKVVSGVKGFLLVHTHKSPSDSGFPDFSIVEMRSCDGEDPPASYFASPAKKDLVASPLSIDKAAKGGAKPAPKQAAAAAPKSAPKAPAAAAANGEDESDGDNDDDDDGSDDAHAAEGTTDDGVPASTLKKPDCRTKTGAAGLKARWCLEKQPFVWVEPRHHRRIVRARAEITNLQPNVSLCGIKVELEAGKSAINTWPNWWPESDEDDPLDPGNAFGTYLSMDT